MAYTFWCRWAFTQRWTSSNIIGIWYDELFQAITTKNRLFEVLPFHCSWIFYITYTWHHDFQIFEQIIKCNIDSTIHFIGNACWGIWEKQCKNETRPLWNEIRVIKSNKHHECLGSTDFRTFQTLTSELMINDPDSKFLSLNSKFWGWISRTQSFNLRIHNIQSNQDPNFWFLTLGFRIKILRHRPQSTGQGPKSSDYWGWQVLKNLVPWATLK